MPFWVSRVLNVIDCLPVIAITLVWFLVCVELGEYTRLYHAGDLSLCGQNAQKLIECYAPLPILPGLFIDPNENTKTVIKTEQFSDEEEEEESEEKYENSDDEFDNIHPCMMTRAAKKRIANSH
jgi:hypothetical protein